MVSLVTIPTLMARAVQPVHLGLLCSNPKPEHHTFSSKCIYIFLIVADIIMLGGDSLHMKMVNQVGVGRPHLLFWYFEERSG